MSKNIKFALTYLALIFLVLPNLARADNTRDFSVSSFIPERFSDLEWTIDGQFYLTGGDAETERIVAPGFNYPQNYQDGSSDLQNIWLGTNAIYFYETVKRQFELNISFDSKLSHRSHEQFTNDIPSVGDYIRQYNTDESRLDYYLNPQISGTVRQYAGDYLFGEFSMSLDYYDSETAYNDRYSHSFSQRNLGNLIRIDDRMRDLESSAGLQQISGQFNIAFGIGHVYEGSFASTALHVIDQIKKEGLLRRDPSKKQMLELTELIYVYRQTHQVDSRYHRQDALNNIVEFLIEERIARDLDSRLLYAIQDIWDYYPSRRSAPRLFGFRLKAGIGYITSYERRDQTVDDVEYYYIEEYDPANPDVHDTLYTNYNSEHYSVEAKQTDEVPFFFASGEYHYPINHLWQLDTRAMVEVNLEDVEQFSSTRRLRDNRDRLSTNITLSRFLDNRTTVSASLHSLLFFLEKDAQAFPSDPTYPDGRHVWHTDLTIGTSLSVLYRIAVPTTFNVTASFLSRYVREPEYAYDYSNDIYNYSINAKISHFIY